jgi:hypothetical protein
MRDDILALGSYDSGLFQTREVGHRGGFVTSDRPQVINVELSCIVLLICTVKTRFPYHLRLCRAQKSS